MRLLIVTPHFYPESFKCNDMAFELAARGHDVTVMTAIPDYPQGHYHEGYGLFKRRRETINGVTVHRSIIIPRRSGSALWLALNYLSYTFFAIFSAIGIAFTHKFDAIVVHEVSPVMVGIPALIIKKLRRCPIYFWVLDLWPESLSAAGGIHNGLILGVFKRLTSLLYRNSRRILISSKGFEKSITANGNFADKIIYFPNWIDSALTSEGNTTTEIPMPEKGFNVVFAGNIGDAQDLPHILEAARLTADSGINFVIVGDGRKRQWAINKAQELGINNISFPGQYPLESMSALFEKADALFLSLKDNPVFGLTVPAKLQAYMSAGKPIVAMLNGEGAELISEAQCGISVAAESPQRLADALKKLSTMSKEQLSDMGLKGKGFATRHFNFERCIDNLESIITTNHANI